MNPEGMMFLIYVLAPFAGALLPWPKKIRSGVPGFGGLISVLRIILLLFLGGAVILKGETFTLSGTLVNGYPLEILLRMDDFRFGFLFTAELCFLLAFWMVPAGITFGSLIRTLMCLAQGCCSVFILSENSVATGGIQILAGMCFFYLLRFSLAGSRMELGESISRKFYSVFFLLGLLMVGWGVAEFGGGDLQFKAAPPGPGVLIWIGMLILAVPMVPWSRWFSQAVEFLPEGVTLALVTFVSAVVLKISNLLSIVYPQLGWSHKAVIYWLGMAGCAFSFSSLFAAKTRRRMLGALPAFFLSLILISVGVSKSSLVISAYFICLFLPVCTGLLLYASVMQAGRALQKVFIGMLLAMIVGLPGTPVYLIFSGIGARSLEMGSTYMLVFVLLWLFYLFANLHICRRIFLDQEPPEPGTISNLGGAADTFTAYGLFLMLFVTAATQIAWRVL